MPNEVVDRIHTLSHFRKSEIRLTFGWWYSTKIVDKQHDEPDQAIDSYNSYYNPTNEFATKYYSSDDDSQYYYDPELVIAGVNPGRNPPPQQPQ